MKVYKDGANCFTCGWNGDVFKFVMDMDKVDFKTAFKSLGGQYEHHKDQAAKAIHTAKLQARKEEIERAKQAEEKFKRELSFAITVCRRAALIYEPLSDGWCFAVNSLESLIHAWDSKYTEGEEIEELNVFRKCIEIRQRFIPNA